MEDTREISSEAEYTVKMLQEVTSSDNTKENISNIYKDWAMSYDKDMKAYGKYRPPELVAELFSKLNKKTKDIRILDLGAGTGHGGEELQKRGFTNIDALDASAEMLEIARGKGIYRNFICDYLGPNRLHIDDDTYDAMVCSGTFVPNHANDSCFEELIRICKPGGLMVFLVAQKNLGEPDFKNRFEPRILQLDEQGAWKWVERKLIENFRRRTSSITERDTRGILYVLEKE